MSKLAAIDVAVRLQLAADQKGQADYTKTMGGAAAPPGSPPGPTVGYAYDESKMQAFLLAVSNRLRLDTPAYSFAWDGIPIANCLSASLEVLIGRIMMKATLTEE
jgi:hypothetical protein